MKTSRVLIISSLILLASFLFFMLFNSNGNWDFILPFRGKKLLLLLTVAYTIGVSTLLFQTLTNNPILTLALLAASNRTRVFTRWTRFYSTSDCK